MEKLKVKVVQQTNTNEIMNQVLADALMKVLNGESGCESIRLSMD